MGKLNLSNRLDNIPTPEESYSQLFGSTGTMTKQLKLSDLHPYPNQPFRPYTQDKLQELAIDIKDNGLQSPIIVREMQPDSLCPYAYYQILAGHNRVEACRLLEMETISAFVKSVDDATAALIMVNTNLNQREGLLPSEKAWAYRLQKEANEHPSGERTDLVHNVHKVDTICEIAAEAADGRRNIAYYIRLTYLAAELLAAVDNDVLPFRVGVALSYLSEDEQLIVDAFLSENRRKINVEQAEAVKRYSREVAPITYAALDKLFGRVVTAQTVKPLRFKKKDIVQLEKYIPNSARGNAADYVVNALKYYMEHNSE